MPSLALGVSINSIPVMGRGETPDPNAPDIASLTLVGSGEVGDELSYSVSYTTPPYPSPTRVPQWLRDGTPIDDETGHTYTPTSDDEGSLISVNLYVVNSEDDDTAVSNGIQIVWPAPILQDVAVSPSSGNTGDIFTVSYTVVGFGTSVSHQWVVGGVDRANETGPTYQARPEDGTAAVTCRVTASNSGGTVEETASPAATVTYTEAPALTGWTLTPGSSAEAGDAIAAQGTVTGVPTPDLGFEWTVDNVTIPNETAPTLGSAPEGAVRCIVTATNSVDTAQLTVGPVTVSGVTPGAPTIDLSGLDPIGYTIDDGVQTLDLSAVSTGDNRGYSAIQTDGLTALAALVVQEGVGGTRAGSAAFPYGESSIGFSYALTGPTPTFTVGSDPRGGITDADLATGVSINTTTGEVAVSSAAAAAAVSEHTVWKYNQAVVASQTLDITITGTAGDIWDVDGGTETITVNASPEPPAAPSASGGVETITVE
jgi:hypothetical protein